MNAPALTRTKNDHNTPKCVLEVVREFDDIALDPCSNPWSTVGARVELSAHLGDDGFGVDWACVVGDEGGVVFVNPPYGRGHLARWVDKCAFEAAERAEIILLVPCAPETGWAMEARRACNAWGVWGKRIPFVGAGGEAAKAANAVYYFGPRRFLFAHVFESSLAFVEVRS